VIAAVDVSYPEVTPDRPWAIAACVLFARWEDETPSEEHLASLTGTPVAYEPGAFFRRELPAVEAVLARLPRAPAIIVVDGYVWLDGGRPGLGAHLHEALGGKIAVIGVAKNPFRGVTPALPVVRGGSARPLFVTAAGLPPDEAAAQIARMHGPHRVPTLLRRVDQLCRGLVVPSPAA
jgi:deoxyribonuclease V